MLGAIAMSDRKSDCGDEAKPRDGGSQLALDMSESVALWIHFQERGVETKGQMYATLTFLDTVLLSLVGFLASSSAESLFGSGHVAGVNQIAGVKWLSVITSLTGLFLSVLSIVLAEDYIGHTGRAFLRSDNIRRCCPKLNDALTTVGSQPPGNQPTPSMAECVFRWMPRFLAAAFAAWSVAAICPRLGWC
jgi:hypothetical protein